MGDGLGPLRVNRAYCGALSLGLPGLGRPTSRLVCRWVAFQWWVSVACSCLLQLSSSSGGLCSVPSFEACPWDVLGLFGLSVLPSYFSLFRFAFASPLRFSEITRSLVGFLTLLASVVSPSSSSYLRVGPVGFLLRCYTVVIPANRPAWSWQAPFVWGIALSSGVQVFSCQSCAPLIKGVRCSSLRDVAKRVMLCVHSPFGSNCRFRGHPGFRGDPYPVPLLGS